MCVTTILMNVCGRLIGETLSLVNELLSLIGESPTFTDESLNFTGESLILLNESLNFVNESLSLTKEFLILVRESWSLTDEPPRFNEESFTLVHESLMPGTRPRVFAAEISRLQLETSCILKPVNLTSDSLLLCLPLFPQMLPKIVCVELAARQHRLPLPPH